MHHTPETPQAMPEMLRRAAVRLARQNRKAKGRNRWTSYEAAKAELALIARNLNAGDRYEEALAIYREGAGL